MDNATYNNAEVPLWDGVRTLVIHLTKSCNMGCSYCLAGDSEILMADMTTKPIKDVVVGDEVMAFDEHPNSSSKNRRIKRAIVKQTFKKKDITNRVELKNGRHLSITPNHKILVGNGKIQSGRTMWRNTRELKIGTGVMGISYVGKYRDINNEQYMIGYIVGMFAGDGSIKRYDDDRYLDPRYKNNGFPNKYDHHRVRLAVKDTEIIDRMKIYLDRMNIDYTVRKFHISKKHDLWVDAIFSSKKDTYDKLVSLIESNVGINNSNNYKAGFLAGIFDAEGHTAQSRQIRIANSDRKLLDETIKCFNDLGFTCKEEMYNPKVHTIRLVAGSNHTGSKEFIRFIYETNPTLHRKTVDKVYGGQILKQSNIVSLSEEKEQYVYNLETTTATYIANGIAVHNCFESEMKGSMSEEDLYRILDRSIDSAYFQNIKTNQKNAIPHLSISFFGGEPLLEYELMKKGVAYALQNKSKDMTLSFGITTNGVLLDKEKVDFMVKHNFSMILSVDGDKESHDINRVYKNGKGTYEDILKNIPYLLEQMTDKQGRSRVTVRPSYTNETGEKLFHTIKHLYSIGFTSLAPIPIIDATKLGKRLDWEKSWRSIEQAHWDIAEWWYDINFNQNKYVDVKFVRDFGRDFMGSFKPNTNLACGTGLAYQAYGSDGYIYPCHRWVNDVNYLDFRMAKISEETFRKDKAKKFWINRRNFTSELGCQHCPIEDICSKGCNVVNYKTTGDRQHIPKEHCWFELLRHKIGMRLIAKYGHNVEMIKVLNGKISKIAMAK